MTTLQADLEKLRYPVGKLSFPETITDADIKNWIETIEKFPSLIRKEVQHLNDAQLNTVYREGGWTIRQVVHHVADSHMNAYMRFKLGLTEDNPTIKPYEEALWAELPEAKHAPVEISLKLIEALHVRWALMLHQILLSDFKRTFFHPANNAVRSLEQTLCLYAWHSRHHLAHITSLKERMGWN